MAKEKTNSIGFTDCALISPLRILMVFAIVISAYGCGMAVMSFIDLMSQPDMDLLLVIMWLLVAPLSFACLVLFFLAVRQILSGTGLDIAILLGFAMMVLASVSNIIARTGVLSGGDGLSMIILDAIVLVCYIIGFLYYQNIGNKALAIFAMGMATACALYYLINGVRLVIDEPEQLLGYLFISYVTAFFVAVVSLFMVISLKNTVTTISRSDE